MFNLLPTQDCLSQPFPAERRFGWTRFFILLFFATGIISNYPPWHHLNNLFLVAAALCALGSRQVRLSPLILLVSALASISLLNHVRFSHLTGGIPRGAWTLPTVAVAMIAARAAAGRGMYRRAIMLNTAPIVLALLLGGVRISWGRLYTPYLWEYMHGMFPQFACVLGLWLLLNGRLRPLDLLGLAGAATFLLLSSRRLTMFYLVLAGAMLMLHPQVWRRPVMMRALAILALAFLVVLPRMSQTLERRLGPGFSPIQHILEVAGKSTHEYSAQTRSAMRAVVFHAMPQYPLGLGHANLKLISHNHPNRQVRTASHPHSAIAESLLTAGYLGAAIYAAILIYILRLGHADVIMRTIILWLLLQTLFETTFQNKTLWALIALIEAELQQGTRAPDPQLSDPPRRA